MAEKRFDQPDELNENEIEKYVYRKIRKDHISSSYRFANVLFLCVGCSFYRFFLFLFYVANCSLWRFLHLPITAECICSNGLQATILSPYTEF